MSPNVPSKNAIEQTEPTTTKSELSPVQVLAARMLGRGERVMAVARKLGVDRKTIARWRRDRVFDAEMLRVLNAMLPVPLRATDPALPATPRASGKTSPPPSPSVLGEGAGARTSMFEGNEFDRAEDYLAAIDRIMGEHRSKLAEPSSVNIIPAQHRDGEV